MMGEAAPYSLVGDNIIMSLFVLNLLAMAYVFLMNGHNILERAKSIFYYGKQSKPYNSRTHITGICDTLLYLQTIFYGSITIFGQTLYSNADGIKSSTAYTALATYAVTLVVAVLLKAVVTDVCNRTIYGKEAACEWSRSFFFTIKLLGFLLTPAVICTIFIKDLPEQYYTIYIIFATLIYLIVVISNSLKNIFSKKSYYLDIFLYLCALELLPMAILWKTIHSTNVFLIIKI